MTTTTENLILIHDGDTIVGFIKGSNGHRYPVVYKALPMTDEEIARLISEDHGMIATTLKDKE